MNRINKPQDSSIRLDNLVYGNRALLLRLIDEQHQICAYTQARFTPTHAADTDHFNPTLKNTDQDGYENWFAISTKWNRKKGSVKKWIRYQPILHPTAIDFENRVIYRNGIYDYEENDLEAKNLINYLNINQEQLTVQRKNHLNLLRIILNTYCHNDLTELRNFMLNEQPQLIQFNRAIQNELGINFP